MEGANVRNLDDIQEDEPRNRSSRWAVLLLASMGIGALAVVGIMNIDRVTVAKGGEQDALAKLVAKSQKLPESGSEASLDGRDATFPSILSDDERPTTALAAVKDARGRLIAQTDTTQSPETALLPPADVDKLPVVPLPAGSLLNATPVTTDPKDPLVSLAHGLSVAREASTAAPAGVDGGFQIQVASFKEKDDADRFVGELKKRGHAAYRQAAHVPDRGLWHRVRVGPFKSKYQAELYRKKLEAKERMAAFIVDPHKVERAAKVRAAKLAARRDGG